MIFKNDIDLVFEILYEYRDLIEDGLRRSEIEKIMEPENFTITSILNNLMTENLIEFNPIMHTFKYKKTKESEDYLKSFT